MTDVMMLNPARIQQISEMLTRLGEREPMPRFAAQMPNRVFEKTSAFDVFSEADQAAEQQITGELARMFPDALLVGEETSGYDPDAMTRLGQAEIAFLIDPIDGTKNFTSGVPLFGTMIAGLRRGEIVFAAIHDPVCKQTALAVGGEGAWMLRSDGTERSFGFRRPVLRSR